MNRKILSSLLSLVMCLIVLTGCSLFSRHTEDNAPGDLSPGQAVTDPAPENTEKPVAPDIAPEPTGDPAPSAEPDASTEPDAPAEPEPPTVPEADVPPEAETDGSEPVGTEDPADAPFDGPVDAAPDTAPLAADELHALEDWFNGWENNGLLRFPFNDLSDPTILAPYLEVLFYDVGETNISAEERALLSDAGMHMETDVFRLGRGYVMRYLLAKLDIDLGNVDMSALSSIPTPGYYLERYDAWYICHGDVMYSPYTFSSGCHKGDTVVVNYVNSFLVICIADGEYDYLSDVEMELTLRQAGSGWIVVSHRIFE